MRQQINDQRQSVHYLRVSVLLLCMVHQLLYGHCCGASHSTRHLLVCVMLLVLALLL
jgi:hypothetical protein